MEGFVGLPSISPYRFNGNPDAIPFIHGNWGKREGRFMTPQGLNYLEFCKAILSQVNHNVGLPPRLRKANTKECGVQVNAKVDKVIQCSLGPKTLFSQESDFFVNSKSVKSPDCSMPCRKAQLNTPVNNMRFLRPLSIYSPVFDRRTILKSVKSSDSGCEEQDLTAEIVGLDDAGSVKGVCETEKVPSPNPNKFLHQEFVGANFQFLEQRYGFFHCRKCNIRWESAYVWCISGTNKVYYKQLCRKCQIGFNPYKVESIVCKGCLQTICCCEKKQRHINMRRPHRQDLCCRCKGSRLSCDATYSFKYIV